MVLIPSDQFRKEEIHSEIIFNEGRDVEGVVNVSEEEL